MESSGFWRRGDGDGGNSGVAEAQEEVEMSRSSFDLDEVHGHSWDCLRSSWDDGKLVGHMVILSTATSDPRVGNPVDERIGLSGASNHVWHDLFRDHLDHGGDLPSLSRSAGREGWHLVVGMGWHQRELLVFVSVWVWEEEVLLVHERKVFIIDSIIKTRSNLAFFKAECRANCGPLKEF